MNLMRYPRSAYCSVIIVTLAVSGLPSSQASAQGAKTKAKTETKTEGLGFPAEVHSVQLRYARATDMASLVEKVFTPLFVVADERTNSIFLRTTGERFVEIRELIKKLDTQAADNEPPLNRISTFPLRSVEPDEALEAALRLIFGKKVTGNFAVDRSRKIVVVSADRVTTEVVAELLARLDTLRTSRPGGDMQLRIVWVVDATFMGPESKPPAESDDLKEVVPGLAKLGIAQPRIAAQFLVNAKPNAQFQATGTTRAAAAPWNVTVSGQFGDSWEQPEMRIVAEASSGQGDRHMLCHVETNVSAPRGHVVVLGVTPTGSTTSAFIMQVLGEKGKKGGAAK